MGHHSDNCKFITGKSRAKEPHLAVKKGSNKIYVPKLKKPMDETIPLVPGSNEVDKDNIPNIIASHTPIPDDPTPKDKLFMEIPESSRSLGKTVDPFHKVDNKSLNSPLQIIKVINSDDSEFVDVTFDDSIESSMETIIKAKNKTFLANSWEAL